MSSHKETIFTRNIFDLPNEIMENIFAYLPLPATLSVCSLVCKSWAEIISNPFFLPWKKLYLSLKLDRTTKMAAVLLNPSRHEERLSADIIMNDLIKKHNLNILKNLFPNAIRFMGKVHKTSENFESFCKSFKQHRLFSLAFDFLHWAPDELISRPFNMWHLITTVIILSEDVWDVYNVIYLLLSSSSNSNAVDVIEALYSLAIVFSASGKILLPSKYHYILYYALYLFENSWQPVNEKKSQSRMLHNGQQSMLKFSKQEKILTHEQATIVGHKIQKTDVLKIVAFAGTGKTTTLLQFCKERPHLKFLLVVYNKSVQEHCYNIFPKNTQIKTAHAMAFARVGKKYSSIKKLDENLNPMEIVDILADKEESGNRYERAGHVKKTLENFINSDSSCLTLDHVPFVDKHQINLSENFRLWVLLDDAQIVWQEMTLCLSSQRVNMTRDGQLKEWQLSKPKIFGYDVIMIGEGQDMNPTIFDIFLNQDLAKVIVGDPYQQIYSFRGATDAIQRINATHTYYLTQSFRFGPKISYVAYSILKSNQLKSNLSKSYLSDVSMKTLVGGSTRDSILCNPEDQMDGMQRAYLCRTNFCLYKLGLTLCKDAKYNDKLFAINGGWDKFGLEDILDIMKLAEKQSESSNGNREVIQFSNKLIGRFESLEELISYADKVEDEELMNKIHMYKYSRTNTTSDIDLLRNKCKNSVKMADIVLSTIHKAKGLEWDWVIMADYILPDPIQELGFHIGEISELENNLLYVAATRAKKRLTINTAILSALSCGLEKFEVFTSSSVLTRDTLCTQCGVVCMTRERENASPPLVTKLQTLPLFNFKFHGGYICDECSEFKGFEVPKNPRRGADNESQTYRIDGGRIARLALLKGKIYTPNQKQLPNRWDQYAGTPRV